MKTQISKWLSTKTLSWVVLFLGSLTGLLVLFVTSVYAMLTEQIAQMEDQTDKVAWSFFRPTESGVWLVLSILLITVVISMILRRVSANAETFRKPRQ